MFEAFSAFAGEHAVRLETVDPALPLDDLEPLVTRLSAARVVAIGETAHWGTEYYLLRHRLLRLLVERCGFTVFAMESGFSEGLAVDDWVRGGPGDLRSIAHDGLTYRMGRCPQMHAHLAWMRSHNATAQSPVRFFGLDQPGSTASPLPALHNVRRYLAGVDADAVPIMDRLITEAQKYAGEHTLPAFRAYAQLDQAVRDEMTALLAELAMRLDALEPACSQNGGGDAYRTARHELRLAGVLDQNLRGNPAARDRGMAETVYELLDRFGPDTKIVLGAANTHIQRTPLATPALALSAMGHHLATRLGDDYVTIAMTGIAGRTSSRAAAPDDPTGVRVFGADLAPPAAGSVEAALATIPGPTVLDLRAARGAMAGPDKIRLMDGYLDTPILDAYDLVVGIPRISTAAQITG